MAQMEPATTSTACASPTPLLASFGDPEEEDNGQAIAAHLAVEIRNPNIQNQAYPLTLFQ